MTVGWQARQRFVCLNNSAEFTPLWLPIAPCFATMTNSTSFPSFKHLKDSEIF